VTGFQHPADGEASSEAGATGWLRPSEYRCSGTQMHRRLLAWMGPSPGVTRCRRWRAHLGQHRSAPRGAFRARPGGSVSSEPSCIRSCAVHRTPGTWPIPGDRLGIGW